MKNKIIIIGLVVVIAGLLYYFTINNTNKNEVIQNTVPETTDLNTPNSMENKITMIDFKFGSKSDVYKFKEGEKVTLSISSDITDEAHLHGYDLSADVSTSERGIITFTATKSGRFPIELEKNGKEIAVIEIYPN